jgi:hypothetical protein
MADSNLTLRHVTSTLPFMGVGRGGNGQYRRTGRHDRRH